VGATRSSANFVLIALIRTTGWYGSLLPVGIITDYHSDSGLEVNGSKALRRAAIVCAERELTNGGRLAMCGDGSTTSAASRPQATCLST